MMKKMESKKSRPRWWDSFFGPKNSNSKWLQENLEEMNWNIRRMLKLIEDSDAESFAKKVEMYYQRRQELISLVNKCYGIHCSLVERYNRATGELLKNIPNSDLIRPQGSSFSSGKSSTIPSRPPLPPFNSGSTQKPRDLGVLGVTSLTPTPTISSPPTLPKFPSSKKLNIHLKGGLQDVQSQGSNKPASILSPTPLPTPGSGSKQLKRLVSVKRNKHHKSKEVSTARLKSSRSCLSSKRPAPRPAVQNIYRFNSSSEPDDSEELHEGTDELEAELRNMIEKLYIQLEGDRLVSKLQDSILRYGDNTCDDDDEFRDVRESVSSDVNKALLEENLELQGGIIRLLKEISHLEEYNKETNERCKSLEAERIEVETLLASEVKQLKAASIVKKNNNVKALNKNLEAVVAERSVESQSCNA